MKPAAKNMSVRLAQGALELFATRGIDAVSMDMVAARSRCTKGSLYWHYDSKKALILAACDLYYKIWDARMEREIAGVRDPVSRLRRVLRGSIRHCMVDRKNRVFTLGIMGLALRDGEIKKSWAGFYDHVRDYFIALVRQAQAVGRVQAFDPRRVVDLMLVAFEGIKLRTIIEPGFDVAAEEKSIYEGLMEVLKCAK